MRFRLGAARRDLGRAIGFRRGVGLLLMGMFVSLRIWDPGIVAEVRLKAFDIYQELHPRDHQQLPVAIVDIDEASLAKYGQWPWPRTRLAMLVDRLTEAGAAAIAFDIVFPEANRTSPDLLADSIEHIDEATRTALRALPNNDVVFAESIARSRVVVGESAYHAAVPGDENAVAIKSPFALVGGDPTPFISRFPGMIATSPRSSVLPRGAGFSRSYPSSTDWCAASR